jgi:hypothetical protein
MPFHSIADKILEVFVRFFLGPVLSISPKAHVKLIQRILFHLNKYPTITDYLTVTARPKNASESSFQPITLTTKVPPTAILMQGPLLDSENFTLGSIRLYRKIFPQAKIVLSTWSDEAPSLLEKMKAAGATIVLCQKPRKSGVLNFNLQRISTIEGLAEVKRLGAQFVLKTRTDQRVNSRYALSLLISLVKKFPPSALADLCKHRVFFLNVYSLANIPFHLSDMLNFGHVDDILRVWDVPQQDANIDRKHYEKLFDKSTVVADVVSRNPTVPEIYIGRNYAEILYGPQCLENPYDSYIRLLKEAVGIVDKSQIDLYWPKYSSYQENADYLIPKNREELSFSKWLTLESGTSDDVVNYDANSKI